MAANGKSEERQDPTYHVFRAEGSTLKIIEWDKRAKSQEKATDQVVEALPVEERNGKFGAFTARSFWSDDYEVEHVTTLKKKGRQIVPPAKSNGGKRAKPAVAKPAA